MAEVFVKTRPPTIVYSSDTLDDPRSFSITQTILSSSGLRGRPSHTYGSTIEVHTYGYAFSFTIGDETEASGILTDAETTFSFTSEASHGGADRVYANETNARAMITGYPPLGGGLNEGRTFTFSGVIRSNDGSTDPVSIS